MSRECRKCGLEKPIEEFEIANIINGKEYRRWVCRLCKHKRQEERKREIREYFRERVKDLKCEVCGFKDHRAFVYHHKDPSKKEIEISNAFRHGWSIARIEKEIAKCFLLCANCHRILHYEERNRG